MSPVDAEVQNPSGAKIVIVTGASLSLNPRAFKEALALARAGFAVTVLGASLRDSQRYADEILARQSGFVFRSVAAPWLAAGWFGRAVSIWPRIRGRLGRDLFRYLGVENRWQIGQYLSELLHHAKNENADYYSAHLESGLWVGERLLSAGYSVGLDMEDWYSEDLLPETRNYRPLHLLHYLERQLLIYGVHASCPSYAMSEALAREYGCAPPSVIYNAFAWSERQSIDGMQKDRRDATLRSIHWVSQTLGRGRGLEDLFAALPFVRHKFEIHLRGVATVGFKSWLMACIPEDWRNNVFIHDLVSNTELLSRIAEHDIGFAGEMKYCRSRDLTITNKILQYLQGGLAVVASDTAGHLEVAQHAPNAVFIYPSGNAEVLARRLDELLESPQSLRLAKTSALLAAQKFFCWERQEDTLLETITRVFGEGTARFERHRKTAPFFGS